MPSFVTSRYFVFAQTPFAQISLTPACAAEKRGHAFYAPVFQSAPCCVRNDTLWFHRTSRRAFVQRIQIKARSQICSSRTAHHANLRGRLLPATDAGVAFMDISAHLLGPMKATQQTWRARFSSAIFLFEFQHSFYFFHDSAFCSFTLWISSNVYVSPRCFFSFLNGGEKRSALHDSLVFYRAVLSFNISR